MKILYLDIDSLRPDHLGCYGYHRNTSPTLDRIAAEGVRFTNCYASDVPCGPSRTALMSGQFGIHSGLVEHGGTGGDMRLEGPSRVFMSRLSQQSLPGFLRFHGYRTGSVSSFAQRHGIWTFNAGFHDVCDTGQYGMESAEDVTPAALRWIAEHGQRDNWFLHVNYWDAHVPYRVPEAFGNPFADEPLPDWLSEERVTPEWLKEQAAMGGVHMASRKSNVYRRYALGEGQQRGTNLPAIPYPRNPLQLETIDDIRALIDGYDCGIRYVDEHVARLLAALDEQGVGEDVTIIIASDHGENIGELGIWGDHVTADELTCHIPLIIRLPGGMRGHVAEGLHYHLDLPATLAELDGIEPPDVWHGRSFAPTLRDGSTCGRDEVISSVCFGTVQRGVRFGDWRFIRTYDSGGNPFGEQMLFHVRDDPHELTDLMPQCPEVCREAMGRLDRWHERMMATMGGGWVEDPLQRSLAERAARR